MPIVDYTYQLPYRYLPAHNEPYPALELKFIVEDVDVYALGVIDTGATQTLFSADIALLLGLNIVEGKPIVVQSLSSSFTVWAHRVRVEMLDSSFDHDICFSERKLLRNLIGRDILEKVQIGIREHSSILYLSTNP